MTAYYTLVASLPALPSSFDAGPLPITRKTLRDRLSLLPDPERQVIDQVARFFAWDRQTLEASDRDVVRTYAQLTAEIRNRLVREIVDYRFEMRTIVAALRRKRDGQGPPPMGLPLSRLIRLHWGRADFNLATRYRWIQPFAQAAAEGNVVTAQHILFTDLWHRWTRTAERYHFAFESILLYLARWEIVERWTSQDAARGRERFEQLIEETLGEYADIER